MFKVGDQVERAFGPGTGFGEITALNPTPSGATQYCVLWYSDGTSVWYIEKELKLAQAVQAQTGNVSASGSSFKVGDKVHLIRDAYQVTPQDVGTIIRDKFSGTGPCQGYYLVKFTNKAHPNSVSLYFDDTQLILAQNVQAQAGNAPTHTSNVTLFKYNVGDIVNFSIGVATTSGCIIHRYIHNNMAAYGVEETMSGRTYTRTEDELILISGKPTIAAANPYMFSKGIEFVPIQITIKSDCECGTKANRGQNHSHWCKLYAKEM